MLVTTLSSCYVLKQADQQYKLLRSARPIQEVIQEGVLEEKQEHTLKHLSKVLDYAKARGLNIEGAYTRFVWNPHDYISYVVYAAKPYELKAKTWWFPIVGRVPYLGYFNPKDAKKKEQDLRQAGYETHLAGVAAYSSLGYFKDPVFRSMLEYSEISFSHLIFHELTHRTIWISSSVEFNENLAEFVAETMIRDFYKETALLDLYEESHKERSRFKSWLKDFRTDLAACFLTPQKKQCKQDIYAEYAGAKYNEARLRKRDTEWNNAVILSYSLYEGDHSCFEGVYAQVDRDLKGFFSMLKKERTCG
jgi:predicted aminopeptidase